MPKSDRIRQPSYDEGYLQATTDHKVVNASGVDANGTSTGFADGYADAATDHKTVDANATDDLGQSTGYNDGYDDAGAFHVNPIMSGTDDKGRERAFFSGYKTARDAHKESTATSYGNLDATGSQLGSTIGYDEGAAFHTTVATLATPANDLAGTPRGYNVGYNAGVDSEIRPHIICELNSNFNLSTGDVIYTLPFANVISSKDASLNTGNNVITLNSTGTWEIFVVFSWAIIGTHNAQANVHTNAYIYESSTQRALGVVRRRSNSDWYGSICAHWSGTVTAGDTFTGRARFDYDLSDSMRIYRNAPDIDSLSIPTNGESRGGLNSTFGPDCRFVAIKT